MNTQQTIRISSLIMSLVILLSQLNDVAVSQVATSFTQVNSKRGDLITYTDASSMPFPNGMNVYDLGGQVSDTFTELKASTTVGLAMENFVDSAEQWMSSEAMATATSSMSDTAIVQGAPGVAGGTLVFTWAADGDSRIHVDSTGTFGLGDQVLVEDLYTSAKLTSDMVGSVTTLLDDRWDFPGSEGAATIQSTNQVYDVTTAAAAESLTFFVPWEGGTSVNVSFDLEVQSYLKLSDASTSKFTAGAEADFLNTATLTSVDVLGSDNQLIPNARLVSDSGAAYPSSGPTTLEVEIDIKPRSVRNRINNNGREVIPVVVFGSDDFDVTGIDLNSVDLAGQPIKTVGRNDGYLARLVDVNDDEIIDYFFKIQDVAGSFDPDVTMATLVGNLNDGTAFQGTDSIRIVNRDRGRNRPQAVPEPTSVGWLAIGCILFWQSQRRRY